MKEHASLPNPSTRSPSHHDQKNVGGFPAKVKTKHGRYRIVIES